MELKRLSTVLVVVVMIAGCAARKNRLQFAAIHMKAAEPMTEMRASPTPDIQQPPPQYTEPPAARIEAVPPAPLPEPEAVPKPDTETGGTDVAHRAVPGPDQPPPVAEPPRPTKVETASASDVESTAHQKNDGKGSIGTAALLVLIPISACGLWIAGRLALHAAGR